MRDAAHPEPAASTLASGGFVTGPEAGLASGTATVATTAEVGAAATTAKPRGHGPRHVRGHDR